MDARALDRLRQLIHNPGSPRHQDCVATQGRSRMAYDRCAEPIKLNLGCGAHVPSGWINVDYAPGARLARAPLFRRINKRLRLFALDWDDHIFIHDLTRPLPWKDSSVDVVYSSHTLEHFSREQGARL